MLNKTIHQASLVIHTTCGHPAHHDSVDIFWRLCLCCTAAGGLSFMRLKTGTVELLLTASYLTWWGFKVVLFLLYLGDFWHAPSSFYQLLSNLREDSFLFKRAKSVLLTVSFTHHTAPSELPATLQAACLQPLPLHGHFQRSERICVWDMCWPDTVVYAYNLSTSDFWVQDQPTLHTNFQGSHNYKVRSYLRQWEKK